jgi:FkbH-like protein
MCLITSYYDSAQDFLKQQFNKIIMTNRNQIYRALSEASRNASTTVIYSSLLHLGTQPHRKYDYLSALNKLMLDGKTILIPSFTFSFCAGKTFNTETSKSETGILSDWFMELDVSSRTKHPIYSFVVAGPDAHETHTLKNTTTFSKDSIFSWIEEKNACIVMLGCGWQYCTQFHRYEEEAHVPYRYFKTFKSSVNYGDGEAPGSSTMFVRDIGTLPDLENDFSHTINLLREQGDFISLDLLGGKVESISCQSLAKVCRKQMESNLFSFIEEPEKTQHLLKQKTNKKTVKIALLGSSNLDFMSKVLQKAFLRHFGAYSAEIFTVPFGQLYNNIYTASSPLHSFEPDIVIFVDRLEDIFHVNHLENLSNKENASTLINEYINAIEKFSTESKSLILISNFTQSAPSLSNLSSLIEDFNNVLTNFIDKSDRLVLFDLNNTVLLDNVDAKFDPRIWYMGRIPHSSQFTSAIAEGLCGIILSHLGLSTRLIIVDLDNTLWGGVLGEDGIDEIKIGGDYPGNAFVDFQKTLKHLSERGVALAICSKNHEGDALSVFDEREEMVLERKDFVSHRINWELKSENIKDIALQLGLSLANILFVDDNPAERDLIKKYLPEVKVLELPNDPALYLQSIQRSPYLITNGVTDEDRKRVKSYQSRAEIHRQRTNYSDVQSFYASLKMHLHFNDFSEKNLARTIQLINKTNQFNTTSLRLNSAELQSMIKNGSSTYVIGLQDKYTELENIGVLIIDWSQEPEEVATITNFLLSCRVLGRGVETGVLSWFHSVAKLRKINTIMASICPTERNTPVQNLFSEHGYKKGPNKGEWLFNLSESTPTIPDWIIVANHCE